MEQKDLSLALQTLRELRAPQKGGNRILGAMLEDSLAHGNQIAVDGFASKSLIRLPIPSATLRVDGSYDILGYEPLEPVGCAGFIDETGKLVIQPQWDFALPFQNGFSQICKNKFWGFINKAGAIISDPQWTHVRDFENGYSEVSKNNQNALLDCNGNIVSDLIRPQRYKAKHVFREGQWKFADANGEILEDWEYVESFSEGFAAIRIGERYGFINQQGEVVVRPEWDCAMSFSEGLAFVRRDGKWGFIDTSGKIAIPCQWPDPGDGQFKDGFCCIGIYQNETIQYGYINREGIVVVTPQWDFACPFSEGLGCVQRDWKRGFVDCHDHINIELQYDFAAYFIGGLAFVLSGTKWGFINRSDEIVVPFLWDASTSYCVGPKGPVYRQVIKDIFDNKALVAWLDPGLNMIWEGEVDIRDRDPGAGEFESFLFQRTEFVEHNDA